MHDAWFNPSHYHLDPVLRFSVLALCLLLLLPSSSLTLSPCSLHSLALPNASLRCSRYRCWFDLTIITVSLIQLGLSELPGVKHLRILRTFRVIRIFGRLRQLRSIIHAIVSSIIPVTQAFIIGIIVIAIYCTLGVEIFGEKAPKEFGEH